MALQLIQDQVKWVDQAKGKKLFEWRVWSANDQHLELFLDPNENLNYAPLPEPLSGKVHHGSYYIRATPPASEQKTKDFLNWLFADDADYQNFRLSDD